MVSAIEEMFADGGADLLLEQLGEPATQYPLGVQTNPVSITAIVNLGAEGEQPIDDQHGTQRVRWLELTVSASLTLNLDERAQQRDTFLVRGKLWHVEGVPRENSGLVTIHCRRTEGASTKRTRTRG